MNNVFVIILTSVFLLIAPPLTRYGELRPAESLNVKESGYADYILGEYTRILENYNWQTRSNGQELRGYYFKNNYSEIIISINREKPLTGEILLITITKNSSTIEKRFKFKKNEADPAYLKSLTVPFLLQVIYPRKTSRKELSAFFIGLSAGYARTNDNSDFLPDYGVGSAYISGVLLYDPSYYSKSIGLNLSIGDYTISEINTNIGSRLEGPDLLIPVRDFYFNIDILLTGRNSFYRNSRGGVRYFYGLFSGLEFLKSGFGAEIQNTSYDPNAMRWDQPMFREQPHIQYIIYRVIQGGWSRTSYGNGIYNITLKAGAGFSINSSLTAVNIDETEEDDLSHIFKSTDDRKENYYNSLVVPLNLSLSADRIKNFRISYDHFFYYFFPMEDETAWDIVNRLNFSTGYYLYPDILLSARYEFWHVNSRVAENRNSHHWNKIVLELKFITF